MSDKRAKKYATHLPRAIDFFILNTGDFESIARGPLTSDIGLLSGIGPHHRYCTEEPSVDGCACRLYAVGLTNLASEYGDNFLLLQRLMDAAEAKVNATNAITALAKPTFQGTREKLAETARVADAAFITRLQKYIAVLEQLFNLKVPTPTDAEVAEIAQLLKKRNTYISPDQRNTSDA